MTKAITLIITLLFGINALADTFVMCVGIGNYADARVQPLPKQRTMLRQWLNFIKKEQKCYYESQLSANGFFTKHLLRGLMGAADVNRDMKITVQEIFSYVSTNVKEQFGDRQHPVMWGNFPNDLTVVRYSKK